MARVWPEKPDDPDSDLARGTCDATVVPASSDESAALTGSPARAGVRLWDGEAKRLAVLN